jgi:rhodanese-related sulfurtransferase
MKKIIVMISLILLLCGCGDKKEEKEVKNGVTSVTCEKALDLQASDAILVDVREKDEYEESHLEGAINIPYTTILDKIDEYATDKDSVIIVYCKSGKRSSVAAKSLSEAGYTKIYDLGSINNCS